MFPLLPSSGAQLSDLVVLFIKNDFCSVANCHTQYFTIIENAYWSVKTGFLEQPLLGSPLHLAPSNLLLYLGISFIQVLNKNLSQVKSFSERRVLLSQMLARKGPRSPAHQGQQGQMKTCVTAWSQWALLHIMCWEGRCK